MPKDMITTGEQALVTLYNRKPGETLHYLHYNCFCEKIATNTRFLYHLLWQLSNSTASVYTYKYRSGKDTAVNFSHLNGDEKSLTGL